MTLTILNISEIPTQDYLEPKDHPTVQQVLRQAWLEPFSTRSNFARTNAEEIAIAACQHLLTVRHDPLTWGRIWRITAAGLLLLEQNPIAGDLMP